MFESRRDIEKGLLLIFNHFAKFGLEMHISRGPEPPKTECIFFPPPGFFKPSSHSNPAVDINSYQVTITEKKYNDKQKRQWEDKSYDEANETNSIPISDGFVTSTKHSIYLGSFVSYNFCDICDDDKILAYGSSSIGELNNC